uniref:Methyltransferase C9orf114 n=1 Tax=Sphaerodactylus townsendi TaxID=933632 RepID=A0ACB8EZT8_9SAUR
MAERSGERRAREGEERKIDWRKWKQGKKEEKKKWKEIKLLRKLEKKRMQELVEKQKEEAKPEEDKGRHYTVSVALPGSILNNAQSPELRTYLAGQIARACTIFCVDEIVVFDEQGEDPKTVEGEFEGIKKRGHACVQLARILQYLECPQYLRKSFFPKHQDLQFADSRTWKGTVVSSHKPRTVSGLYWGYSVRLASCLSAVFAECPFKEGYDLSIGTSERGISVDQAPLPPFSHALIVFGGLQGLEAGVDADPNLEVSDPSTVFDLYLNTCPGQGSRTIRTEEAILISLSALRPRIDEKSKEKQQQLNKRHQPDVTN